MRVCFRDRGGCPSKRFGSREVHVLICSTGTKVRSGQRGNRSGRFWFAGDLALDLLSEFQGPGNLRKNFGRPARASHDDGSVAQDPSQRRLLDRDAFDSLQKKLDGAAIHDPRLYDDSFIGDGHLRSVAPHKTNPEKDGCYQQTAGTSPSQRTRERSFATLYGAPR